MKLLDLYIIKRYLGTFIVMILLFIPIGIMVDVAEKIDKFKEKEVPIASILDYYIDFTWYFANLLFPIFLFLSVIWFTSKLANNTEVIAILSSGISFFRYLRPFLLAAGFIAVFAFFAGMYVVPKSNLGFNDFRYKYIVKKEVQSFISQEELLVTHLPNLAQELLIVLLIEFVFVTKYTKKV